MELKIISFNIRCCDDLNGHSIAERAPRLASIMDQYQADVIGFQEYRPAWGPHLKKYFGAHYEVFHKYRCQAADSELESTPLLWRKDKFECLKKGYFWLSDTPEIESCGWDELYHCCRICVYVVLKEVKTGKCFTVINTHFGFGDGGQVKSARLIHQYSKKISDHPTLIVGDFNMTPDSVGYQEMTRHFVDVNAATVGDLGVTYHGYDPARQEACHIDYCFVDPTVIPKHQRIMRETVGGKYPSDHYGLYMEVSI